MEPYQYFLAPIMDDKAQVAAWVCMSFKTATGANLIVTVDEPIE